jgi:CBS domain containing-hemolysin-like protein
VVTVEDLVEELVGEIADEHDQDDQTAAVLTPPDLTAPDADRIVLIDGVLREDELMEQTGFRMPPGPYETLAGFLMARLGHIPEPGERLAEDDWEFTVIKVVRHRIELVRVTMPRIIP